MSILPGRDIIFDSVRAADPDKHARAMRRLEEFARDAGVADGRAGERPRGVGALAKAHPPVVSTAASQRVAAGFDPVRKFEAFVLQSFVETMLPKQNKEMFGRGTAGDVWRSMMAEQIADQLAKAGGLGLDRVMHLGKKPEADKNNQSS